MVRAAGKGASLGVLYNTTRVQHHALRPLQIVLHFLHLLVTFFRIAATHHYAYIRGDTCMLFAHRGHWLSRRGFVPTKRGLLLHTPAQWCASCNFACADIICTNPLRQLIVNQLTQLQQDSYRAQNARAWASGWKGLHMHHHTQNDSLKELFAPSVC